MKTFSIAFILGILVGALATLYIENPDRFKSLLGMESENGEQIDLEQEINDLKDGAGELIDQGVETGKFIYENREELIETGRDATIHAAVLYQFKTTEGLDTTNVNVKVVDGTVILSGSVPSSQIEKQVIFAAQEAKFVSSVKSELKVRP